jgi:hypothetical protein
VYNRIVDKETAKNWAMSKIGSKYIVPNIGVFERVEDIDFDKLPDQFVLKCTHDSGSVVICRDKDSFDWQEARVSIKKCLHKNHYWVRREWPYRLLKARVIVEEFLDETDKSAEVQGLTDYKFYCFNGKPEFLYIAKGSEYHNAARCCFIDMDWELLDVKRVDYAPFVKLPKKPETFSEMKQIAETLSKDFIFVRVDLFTVNRKVYFSEMTLYPCGGFIPFQPMSADYNFGKYLKLPSKRSLHDQYRFNSTKKHQTV